MCYDDQSLCHASCFCLRRGVTDWTGGQTGRGGERTREQTGRGDGRTGDQGGRGGGRGNGANAGIDEVLDFATIIAQQLQYLLPTIVAQVGDHVSNQGNIRSQNDNASDDNIHEDDRNDNGGGVAYIHWVEKMEAVQDSSGCGDNQKVKYYASLLTGNALTWWNSEVWTRGCEAVVGMTWEDFKALMKEEYCPSNEIQKLETKFWNHGMVEAGHSIYTDRFYELVGLVLHLVTHETKRIERYIYGLALQISGMVAATEPSTIQSAILKAGMLTDEAVRNGSLKRSGERRGDGRESSSSTRCTNCNFHYNPETLCRMCTNCNRLGHFAKDYRAWPRMVNRLNSRNLTAARRACYKCGGTDHYKSTYPRLNRAPGQGGNRPNQAMAIEGGQGRGNNGNPAHRRAFVMGAEEAR
ncbi:reverse transcriptase domain-containing protein [Tanacetum coccineum]